MRALLFAELRRLVGRNGGVRLFQDVAVIAYGDLWEQKIRQELNQSSFLVPILTPDFFQSPWCCKEVEIFRARETLLGRDNLIFPIVWMNLALVEPDDPNQVVSKPVWDRLREIQQADLTEWRHHPLETTVEVRQLLARLAEHIVGTLRRRVAPPPPPPPQPKPAWASAIGTDQFGEWADIAVPAANGSVVTQRLRAIPAGKFRMGSPDSEEGRFNNEGPVHGVDIRQSFWLFDTPCTQELWQAVMGENPSGFVGPKRPVENVNIEDTTAFLTTLDRLVPGLGLSLPSEAQWEYACRAGTTGATYAKSGQYLDDIAWYDNRGGETTKDVKVKAPNDWGLYDMLGNVGEWCADGWVGNYNGAPTNGIAHPAAGSADRVVRGGAWSFNWRYIRAAGRIKCESSARINFVGFRCARFRTGD